MQQILLILFLIFRVVLCEIATLPKFNIIELSARAGYVAEPHEVTTEDGYILTFFRLINSTNYQDASHKEPVFLLHGLACSCESFTHIQNDSLTFFLTRNNYDVWIGNSRGNFYGRKHTSLDPDKNSKFWFFTFDQIGRYDLPAMIDYILKVTNRPQLTYVGYSQGSASFFAMISDRPEYNSKIKFNIALAPPVFMKHHSHPIVKLLSGMSEIIKQTIFSFNLYEVEPIFKNKMLESFLQSRCGRRVKNIKKNCGPFIDLIESRRTVNVDYSIIPDILGTTPAGMSIFQALHFLQLTTEGQFEKFDWGPALNLQIHNSIKPPKYDLSKAVMPIAIFYGLNDGLVDYRDVQNVCKSIVNLTECYKVPDDNFMHVDFTWGRNLIPVLYNKILELLNKFSR